MDILKARDKRKKIFQYRSTKKTKKKKDWPRDN